MKAVVRFIGVLLAIATGLFLVYGFLFGLEVQKKKNFYFKAKLEYPETYECCMLIWGDNDTSCEFLENMGDENLIGKYIILAATNSEMQSMKKEFNELSKAYSEYIVDVYEKAPSMVTDKMNEYGHTNPYNEIKTDLINFDDVMKNETVLVNRAQYYEDYRNYLTVKKDFYQDWVAYLKTQEAQKAIKKIRSKEYLDSIESGETLYTIFVNISAKDDSVTLSDELKEKYQIYQESLKALEEYK